MSSQKSALPVHPSPAASKDQIVGLLQRQNSSTAVDPYAAPEVYYGESHSPRRLAKSRTYSAIEPQKGKLETQLRAPGRRTSHGACRRACRGRC